MRANNWALVVGLFIGLILLFYGYQIEFSDGFFGQIFSSLTFMIVAWLILFLIFLIISPLQLWKDGSWSGLEFVYKEPKLAFTTHWIPEDNGAKREFIFSDAPPDSLIWYKIETDGADGRVWGHCVYKDRENTLSQYKIGRGINGIRLSSGYKMWLAFHSVPNTRRATIRVYVMSWEL
jgi:hypothetical protein